MEHNLQSTDEDAAVSAIEVQNAMIYDTFHSSCSAGDIGTLKSILSGCTEQEKHEFLHHCDAGNCAPIVDAIFAERADVVEFLVENGFELETECDVNLFYPILLRDKLTALCVACAIGNFEITKLLLERGSQVNHCSKHSSPLIYASEYDNVALVSLLLEYGADIHSVPQSLSASTAVLPLYQACMCGHSATAELLFERGAGPLNTVKRVCLLGLLGAQCMNKKDDIPNCLRHWKQALTEMREHCPEDRDLSDIIDKVYLQKLSLEFDGTMDLGSSQSEAKLETSEDVKFKHRHEVFKDMKLCATVEELAAIEHDENMLRLQGLLVLECILGPSHTETTQQVSKLARHALENDDLTMTCKLFLYIIEGNVRRNDSSVACEYTAQLAELLLNAYTSNNEILKSITEIGQILEAAIEFTSETVCTVFKDYAESSTQNSPNDDASVKNIDLDLKKRQHEQIKLLAELCETLVGYVCILLREYSQEQWTKLCTSLVKVLQLSSVFGKTAFNVECELLKLAVYSGQSATSTLYFFQESLLPDVKLLECLLHCGADVDRQDMIGNTALHQALNCGANVTLTKRLIEHGAHIDISNHAGVTPLALILKNKNFQDLHAFRYITLKCLAATSIMRFRLPYVGQVPVVLEKFIACHGIPLSKDRKMLKRSASEGDNNPN